MSHRALNIEQESALIPTMNSARKKWDNRVVLLLLSIVTGTAQEPPSVIINEIHYDPADKTERGEFIELFNPMATAVDLSGWAFAKGLRCLEAGRKGILLYQ
jgi:hypothetical protein